jgi:hypothetical protein
LPFKLCHYTIVFKMILIIDGSGGKIGSEVIKKIRKEAGSNLEIIAVGTNAIATNSMIKAGANNGASGENALCQMVKKASAIIGPANIVIPNSFLGELTPEMANSVADCSAKKYILPIDNENTFFILNKKEPLPHMLDNLLKVLKEDKHV